MKAAGNAMGDLDNSSKKTNTSILDIAKGVGVFKLLEKATGALVGSLDGAIKRYDTMNQFPKVMEAIGFSTIQSERSVKKLADGIDGLPTSLDAIVGSTQKIALLTGDLDKATETSIALNNAFLASGSATADAERGLVQYTQMLSKGEVDLTSWRTLLETMGPALREVASAFGFTKDPANELYEALKSGSITFDQMNSKIVELDGGLNGFASRAAEASAGIGTSMQNLKTSMVRGVTTIIEATDQMLADNGFPKIAEIIDNAKVGINKSTKAIADNIGVVASAVMALSPYLKIGASAWGAYEVATRISSKVKKTSDAIKTAGEAAQLAAKASELKAKAEKVAASATLANEKATRLTVLAEKASAKAKTAGTSATALKTKAQTLNAKAAIASAKAETANAAAEKASTAAKTAGSAAVTIKGALISVLTGKIGVATGTQLAWNAAMAASPIGTIITVVAAAGTGIYALSRAFADNNYEAEKLKKKHDELISSSKELVDASKGASKSRKDNASGMEIEAQAARGLASDVVNLSRKQNKSAADHKELQSYVTMLNNSVDGLNLAYDEQSGTLNMTSKEIYKMIDSYEGLARAQAAQEAYVDVAREKLDVERQLATLEVAHGDAMENRTKQMVKGMEHTQGLTKADEERATQIKELTGLLEELGVETEYYTDILTTSAQEQADAVSSGTEQQITSLSDLSESQRETIESMKATWQGYAETTTDMFNKISTESETSLDEMIANLQHNQEATAKWAENMNLLADTAIDEGLLEQLRVAGPESAGLVQELVNGMENGKLDTLSELFTSNTQGAIDAMNSTLNTANIDEGVMALITQMDTTLQMSVDATFTKAAEGGATVFGDTLSSAPGAAEGGEKLVNTAIDAAAKAGIKFEDIGKDGMDGLHIGMIASTNKISDAAAEIILDGIKAAKEAQNSNSPSKVYEGLGTDAIDGYVQGVEGQQGTLDSAISGAIEQAITAATKATQSGIEAMSNISGNSFLEIGAKAKAGMSAMVVAIASGMNTSRSAMQSGTNANVQVTTMSMQRIRSATQAGMSANTQVVTSGMRTMQSATTSGMSALARAVQVGMSSSQNAVRSGTSAMNAIVSNLQSGFYSSGVYASQGLAQGINAGASSAMAAARRVASSVAATMRNALDIHSPSRVTEEIGEYTSEGVEIGMLNRLKNIKSVANTIAEAMIPQASISSRLAPVGHDFYQPNMESTFSTNATYTIIVPVEVDGREFARATASFTQEEIEKAERRNNRMQGRR